MKNCWDVSESALGLIRVAFERGDMISEFGEDVLREANKRWRRAQRRRREAIDRRNRRGKR